MKRKAKQSKSERKGGFKLCLPGSLLVFESTGFALYGLVARRGVNGTVVYGSPAVSLSPDFATAVGEVLEQLRGQSKRLPSKAVLVTPLAAGAPLHLPVDTKSPRPAAQMRELVRWEFEEVFVQQNDIWSLGAVLQGRGYVTPQQRRELETAEPAGRNRGSLVGVYRDTISREQLDECLALQEQLIAMDDELSIGWSPMSSVGEDGRFAWYGAGTSDSQRAQWVQAFKQHGIFCFRIYPQMGAALPLLPGKEDEQLLVDVRQEQFGMFKLVKGSLDDVSIQTCSYGSVDPEVLAAAVARFIEQDSCSIYISAPENQVAVLLDALKQKLEGHNIASVVEESVEACCPRTVWASLQGATRHALKMCSPTRTVTIQAQPPQPPVWKTRAFWPWAIIALLIVAIVSTEIYNRVQADKNEWELELLDIEYERRLQIKSEAQKTQTEIHQLEDTLSEKEQAILDTKRRIKVLNDVILARQEMIPDLLQAIGEAIPGEVVIDVLEENRDRSGFYLEGWALSDTEAQRFASRLNEKLAPWHYDVADMQLSRGKSRLGADGFQMKIQLLKKKSTKEVRND